MLALILLNFALTTIYCSSWVSAFIIQVRTVLVNNIDNSLEEKFAKANNADLIPNSLLSWTECLQVRSFHFQLVF